MTALFHGGLWVGDLDDQFVVPLVFQFNHDRTVRVVDIPENPLAVLIKRASDEHSGNIGAGHPNPVPPAMGYGRVCPDLRNVRQRDSEGTL